MQALGRLTPALAILLPLAAWGLLTAAAPAEPAHAAGAGCRYVSLSPRPGWVNSGAWMKDGTELVVADVRDRKILSFDPQGRGFMAQPQELTRAIESSSPQRILSDPRGNNLFIELEWGRFAVLDSRGAFPLHRKNLFEESLIGQASQGTRSLDKLYLWAPVNTDILSYASIKSVPAGGDPDNASWSDAFVRFPIDNPQQFRPLVARNRDASKIFYKLGHPLISSLGDTGYLLLLDSGSLDLYRSRKGSSELEPMKALDGIAQAPPMLPSFVQPDDFPAVMRAVERSSMPVGLYGWGDSLYALFRSPARTGTKWSLVKVNPDPNVDSIVTTFDIPTRANHLTVVPGPRQWAFIEKGPVRGHKDQDVNSVLFVPSSHFRSASGGNLCR